MIGIYHIDTKDYFNDTGKFYNMLEIAEGSVVTINIDGEKIRLKCTIDRNGTCDGCYFCTDKSLCPSKNGFNTVGLACCPKDRTDGIHCVFKRIEDKKQNKK